MELNLPTSYISRIQVRQAIYAIYNLPLPLSEETTQENSIDRYEKEKKPKTSATTSN